MNSTQEYQNWLALTAGNAQEQEELRALASDPAELEDRFYRELSFGTAGMPLHRRPRDAGAGGAGQ